MQLTTQLKQHIIKIATHEVSELAQQTHISDVASDVTRINTAIAQFKQNSNATELYNAVVISDTVVREFFEGTLTLTQHVMHCEASFCCSCVADWDFVL